MQKYTEEFLDSCCDTLRKADEIQNNGDLMKELSPYMKQMGERITDIPGSLKQKFQKKLNDTYKEEADEGDKEELDESPDDKMKIPSKP